MKKLFSVKNNKKKNKKTCHNNVRYYGIVTPGCLGGNTREDQAQELGLSVTF